MIVQIIQTIANFEVWIWSQYDVIHRILWLNNVDVWIACKHGEIHDKLSDRKPSKIKGKKALPNVPLLSTTQIKRCLQLVFVRFHMSMN